MRPEAGHALRLRRTPTSTTNSHIQPHQPPAKSLAGAAGGSRQQTLSIFCAPLKVCLLSSLIRSSSTPRWLSCHAARRYHAEDRLADSVWFKQRILAAGMLRQANAEIEKTVETYLREAEEREEELSKRAERGDAEYIRAAGAVRSPGARKAYACRAAASCRSHRFIACAFSSRARAVVNYLPHACLPSCGATCQTNPPPPPVVLVFSQVDMSDLDNLALAAAAAASTEKPILAEVARIRAAREKEAAERREIAKRAVEANNSRVEAARRLRLKHRLEMLDKYRSDVEARLKQADDTLREARLAAETEEYLVHFARLYADEVAKKYAAEKEESLKRRTAAAARGRGSGGEEDPAVELGAEKRSGPQDRQRDSAIAGLATLLGVFRRVIEYEASKDVAFARAAKASEEAENAAKDSKGKGKARGATNDDDAPPPAAGVEESDVTPTEEFDEADEPGENRALGQVHDCLGYVRKALALAACLATCSGVGMFLLPAFAVAEKAIEALETYIPDKIPSGTFAFMRRLYSSFGGKPRRPAGVAKPPLAAPRRRAGGAYSASGCRRRLSATQRPAAPSARCRLRSTTGPRRRSQKRQPRSRPRPRTTPRGPARSRAAAPRRRLATPPTPSASSRSRPASWPSPRAASRSSPRRMRWTRARRASRRSSSRTGCSCASPAGPAARRERRAASCGWRRRTR